MRVLRFVRLGVGAALALSVCATAAVGQEPQPVYPECKKTKPAPEDVEAAKGAHTTAAQFYDRGDYDSAIAQWLIAYNKFDCTAHGLLLNIANAQEKKGDKKGAILSLRTYLDRMGKNAAPNVEQRWENLVAQTAPPPSATATAPPPLPTAPTASPSVTPTAVPTTPPPGTRPYGVYPWVTVGGGSAIAVVGVILLGVGTSTYNSANAACPSHKLGGGPGCTASVTASGNTGVAEQKAGWSLLPIGVAAAAGGLIWQFLYNKPSKAASGPSALEVVPLVGRGQGGVGVAGTF